MSAPYSSQVRRNNELSKNMTTEQAIEILKQIKKQDGAWYKQSVRKAWKSGDYASGGLQNWAESLEQMKGTFSTKWLAYVNV